MAKSQVGETTTPTTMDEGAAPQVGERAPEFFVETPTGRISIGQLAAQVGTLVLVSLDSYRYHPG